ncbi:MAG TPA: 50S ribosomal protein L11 methyltransferase [Sphingomonas sp.]|jgi:ribosomal protein L11 methyltransferase|nr:50S ribosomal protein L11 methyltransferase [Sphingomonas sp.]
MSAESWKLTLPCTRAEAEAIDLEDWIEDRPEHHAPVLMTTEDVIDDAERWHLDAYFEHRPDAATIAKIRLLVPSAAAIEARLEQLAGQDWVTLSQAGLVPVRAGRFVVHTGAHPAEPPVGGRAFLIEASQAFGTGHHETTAGCLEMLDRLAVEGGRFASVVDLGTGTGLLAFAARELWPEAAVMATDIDPIAIEVTRDNAAVNAVAGVALVVADGTRDAAIVAAAPFDLVIANILAGPLIDMAADVATIAAPGATIVLAGLLTTQADAVVAAYAACGMTSIERAPRGDWSILRLQAA